MGTGRVWGVAAGRATSVHTSDGSSAAMASAKRAAKGAQRRFGSVPVMATRSCGVPARRAAQASFPGHVISRSPPSTSRTSGRVSVKTKYSSGSTLRKRSALQASIRRRAASVVTVPVSLHPVNAMTTTGARNPSTGETSKPSTG